MYYYNNGSISSSKTLKNILEAEYLNFPGGSLVRKKSGSIHRSVKKVEVYLKPRDQRIKIYCRKRLVLQMMREINKEKQHQIKIQDIIKNLPKSYHGFQTNNFYHADYEKWISLQSPSSQFMKENLKWQTTQGFYVRSKSEREWCNRLIANKIPFLYEYPLRINNITIYPDFTIICPYTTKIKLIEHFGYMDDLAYQRKTTLKLRKLHDLGFTLFTNLIFTFESDIQIPEEIDKIIHEFILNPYI